MKFSSILLPFAALALAPTAAHAEEARKASNDYIAFANHGGVRDWRAEDRDTVYFQDGQRHWYRAELMAPASDLPFTQFIGIDSDPGDRLDKFSTIYIRGQRYALKSFERIEGSPPPKQKRAKADKAS